MANKTLPPACEPAIRVQTPEKGNYSTMNRIYQGRVTKVEISAGKDEWKVSDDGEFALWQHHEFFQDAVN